eukprot:TRINITY_DN45332_c0_g1_i1.p1 TRINITY_DN45332_c0_g1~~TRINITY_DN45332_c0_g1_i1.p1  ORF type:complete len:492 (-),score=133.23 TRINITY_DN45332_c0_g1_i1:92-1567(-)
MESHGVLGPHGQFNHIYSYQTADKFCIAVQLRPPYESGRVGTQIHKITSEWDTRKGIDDFNPNDVMIRFSERSLEVCKRGGSSAWQMLRGLHGATFQQLDRERCFWTMTKHGGRYWLVSIELVKKTPGKLWSRLMRDEREANRPQMKWDKEMQKTAMIADRQGQFVPSTYCHPHERPKYEQQEESGDQDDAASPGHLEDATAAQEVGAPSPITAQELVLSGEAQPGFELEESTVAMAIAIRLDPARWRELQRRQPSANIDAFVLEIPFGGNHIDFYLKEDRGNPILKGPLGGCVWRAGCRWDVETRQGKPVLELYMPKQTPEPWSHVVEGYDSLRRNALDPYQQMILDGLWDTEAIEEKSKGDDYFRQGEYRAAALCYSRTLERNPDSYITLTNRAAARLAYEGEKFKVEDVLEDALRALEINPGWHKAKVRQGVALAKLHRYDEAIAALEEGKTMDKSCHPGWDEEISKVKQERIEWANRKKLSFLNDVE